MSSCRPSLGTLVVMVKAPVMGRVKTRLARDIGPVAATSFYRAASRAVIGRLAQDPRWRTVLAVAPDIAVATSMFAEGPDRFRQGGGDLGQRLSRAVRAMVPGPVLVIGTDIPGITSPHIARAFQSVRRDGAVLGEAPDGGYWLVGLKQSPRKLAPFAHVRWSSKHALADTAQNLIGVPFVSDPVPLLGALDDIDDGPAFATVKAWYGRRVLPRT